MEKDKNDKLPAQNILLLVDLLISVIMDMLVFSLPLPRHAVMQVLQECNFPY